jgi:hypothetical protein
MNIKTLILAVALLGMVAYGGYYYGTKKFTPTGPAEVSTTATTTATVKATPTVDEKAALTAAVKQGLVAEHGSLANNMNVTVSKIEGNYAQGGAVDPASVGGAMWLAVKVNGSWTLVWDGNGTISCSLMATYPGFPVSMVPECWDESSLTSVKR